VAVVTAVVGRQDRVPPPLTPGTGVKIEFSDKPVPVPTFTLADLSGGRLANDTGRGKVVLVNFWATWCGPCREEIPALIALQTQYEGRLVILGLSVDEPGPNTAAMVQAFARKLGINYIVGVASPEVQMAFGGISSVPSTFIVNPAGGACLWGTVGVSIEFWDDEGSTVPGPSHPSVILKISDGRQASKMITHAPKELSKLPCRWITLEKIRIVNIMLARITGTSAPTANV
jgi:thiol-disulfide isomerase/thioredoxin